MHSFICLSSCVYGVSMLPFAEPGIGAVALVLDGSGQGGDSAEGLWALLKVRRCLCLVFFRCLRGSDAAFALCFHCLRG